MMRNRLTPEEKAIRLIKEKDWQKHVMEMAKANGWLFYHAPDNKPMNGRVQNITAGFPDLVLIKPPFVIFAELKRETGKLSPAQENWLYLLKASGQEAYVWRPSQINEVLKLLRR